MESDAAQLKREQVEQVESLLRIECELKGNMPQQNSGIARLWSFVQSDADILEVLQQTAFEFASLWRKLQAPGDQEVEMDPTVEHYVQSQVCDG